jgi:hypothetical protein
MSLNKKNVKVLKRERTSNSLTESERENMVFKLHIFFSPCCDAATLFFLPVDRVISKDPDLGMDFPSLPLSLTSLRMEETTYGLGPERALEPAETFPLLLEVEGEDVGDVPSASEESLDGVVRACFLTTTAESLLRRAKWEEWEYFTTKESILFSKNSILCRLAFARARVHKTAFHEKKVIKVNEIKRKQKKHGN